MFNFALNFKPGQGVPPHQHDDSDLIVHVLFEEGELQLYNKVAKVGKGDVFYCEGNEFFSIKNIGNDEMPLFAILAPNNNIDFTKEV